jgi:hypothetical protein
MAAEMARDLPVIILGKEKPKSAGKEYQYVGILLEEI